MTAAAVVLAPHVTQACEVCYGQSESAWIDAARAGVWLMVGVTAIVQAAFAVFFLRLRSRMKAAARRTDIKLVEGKGAA